MIPPEASPSSSISLPQVSNPSRAASFCWTALPHVLVGRIMLDVSSYPATVAELVDAQDLGSCGATRGGSSPSGRIRTCRIRTRRCRKNALALQRRTRHLEGDPMDQTFQELRLAWARLRLEVDCGLRRGTWYRVTRFTPTDIFLDVQHCPVPVPRHLLDVLVGRPHRRSVVPRPRDAAKLPPELGAPYAVCPACRARSPLRGSPATLACPRCRGVFVVAWDERYLTEQFAAGEVTARGS